MKKQGISRKLAVAGVLSALSVVLFYIKIALPFMPPFISLDFSDLPALLASFALGPLWGAGVCLIKNLIGLIGSMTGGVGELSNFILSVAFVVPAGLIYRRLHSRPGALSGAFFGALLSSYLGLFFNYYLVYPAYTLLMPMDVIIGMYKAIDPTVNNLWDALLRFNLPFTFGKELISVIITFLIYKPLSPYLKAVKTPTVHKG